MQGQQPTYDEDPDIYGQPTKHKYTRALKQTYIDEWKHNTHTHTHTYYNSHTYTE